MTESEIVKARKMIKNGMSGRVIADKLNVHHSTIYALKNKVTHNPERILIAKEIQRKSVQGESNYWVKLTERKVKRIRIDLAIGYTQFNLAIKHGVSPQLISLIKLRKIWKHI